MKTIVHSDELESTCRDLKAAGKKIVFVPTMGDLHAGHLALFAEARKRGDVVVTSVYVNPRQFNDLEDFKKYPRSPEEDLKKCASAGVDILFQPKDTEVYPEGGDIKLPLPRVATVLEGALRPGHFEGVVDVVNRLFQLVQPHIAIFGLKDYQQVRVIEELVKEQKFDIEIVRHPIVREKNGLALSSRNRRLSPVARTQATQIFKSLRAGEFLFNGGEKRAQKIKECILRDLAREKMFQVEDVSVVDAVTLEPVDSIRKATLVAVAVFIEGVRLIDNCLLASG